MANVVEFILKAKDNASKEIGGVSKAFEKLTGISISTGIGIASITTAIAASMKAAAEAEVISAQLNAVIKSTGGAANLTADELNGMALELSRLTGIEDDSIVKAEAVMLTFTKIGKDVFPEAIKAAANMSAALGQDLQSSVIQLGKALNDPIQGITALQRVGVAFTKDQKEQIKTLVESGNTMEAQRIILAELTTEFGGASEAIGNTFTGSLKKAQNELGNLQEAYGQFINDALRPAIDLGNKYLITANDINSAEQALQDAVDAGIISQKEANSQMFRMNWIVGNASESMEWLTTKTEEYNYQAQSTAEIEAMRARQYQTEVIPAIDDATEATERLASGMWESAEAGGQTTQKIKQSFTDMTSSVNRDLDSVIENMQADMKWLAAGGLELQAEYARIIQELNNKTLAGTQYAAAEAYKEMEAVQAKTIVLKDEIAGIDPTETAQKISETLGLSLQASLNLVRQIRADAQFDITSYVRIKFIEEHGDERTGESRVGGEVIDAGGASGLDMVVPSGYPNDSFRVGATSGERVTITPTNNYNLTINSNARSENVAASFALMKAMG